MFELERRGKLPENKKALLQEARRRGLVPQEERKSLLGFAGNVAGNVLDVAKGTAQVIPMATKKVGMLPIEAARIAQEASVGKADTLKQGIQEQQQGADAARQDYKSKYGSIEGIKKAIYERPVEVAMDVASLLGLGGGVVSKTGKLASLPKVAKVGQVMQAADPLNFATKASGKLLSKANVTPFAGQMDVKTLSAANRLGVEEGIPASAITKSPAVRGIETIFAKGFFGGRIVNKINEFAKRLNTVADETVSKITETTDLSVIGRSFYEGMEKFKSSYYAIRRALYKEAEFPMQTFETKKVQSGIVKTKTPGLLVETNQSLEIVKNFLDNQKSAAKVGGKATNLGFWENLNKKFLKKIEIKDLNNFQQEVRRKISNWGDPVSTGYQSELKALSKAIDNDIDNALMQQRPDIYEKLKQADAYYKQGLEKLNSEWGKTIKQYADDKQFDKIVDSVINPRMSVEDIPRIFEVVGKDNLPNVQAVIMKNIFEKARSTADEAFTQAGINKAMKMWGDNKLKVLLTPKQFQFIKDMSTVTKGFREGQKIAAGSQTAFTQRVMGEVGALATTAGYAAMGKGALPFVGALIGAGVDAGLSYFIGSPIGQRLLTKGFNVGKKPGTFIARESSAISKGTEAAYIGGKSKDRKNWLSYMK